tara:strand:+ start:440 stop:1429 length:990 start_codon:yes stop_codon:yes gene_type:complete
MKTIKLNPILTDAETNDLQGKFLDTSFIKHHITEDTQVFKENGDLLAVFKKNVVPKKTLDFVRTPFRKACKTSSNRGIASGTFEENVKRNPKYIENRKIKEVKKNRITFYRSDGTVSKTAHAFPVNSSLIGFSDRYPRIPYCRTTAYTQNYFKEYTGCLPYIRCVNDFFKNYAPLKYKIQRKMAEKTEQDFVIEDTAFTTVTVNKNFQTACHKDAGDLKEGFGNLGVISRGKYGGYITVLPKYGVGLDLNDGDLALFDVHEVHGNTEHINKGYYERISVVCYYREKMIYCGNKEYELERAKKEIKKVALEDEIIRADKIKEEILKECVE